MLGHKASASTTSVSFLRVATLLYLGVLVAGLYLSTVSYYCSNLPFGKQNGVLVGTISLLIILERWSTNRFGYAMTRRTALALIAVRMGLYEVVSVVDCSEFSSFLYLIIPFTAYFSLGKRASLGFSLFYLGVFITKHMIRCPECDLVDLTSDILIFGIGLAFAVSMASVVRDEERSRTQAETLLQDLEASHQKLQTYANQVAELATTEERNRLARDIHDSLGHHLTVINIQLEKAVAFWARDNGAAEQAVQDAKRTASEALRDVRQSVSALREPTETFSLSASLHNLISHMNNGRLHVELSIQGDETAYSRPVLMALYRVAQEALTNIQKHARAQEAKISLHFDTNAVHCHIEDDGQGFETAVLPTLATDKKGRFGLQGVQERLELVGGTLTINSQLNHGTQLYVHIPQGGLALHDT